MTTGLAVWITSLGLVLTTLPWIMGVKREPAPSTQPRLASNQGPKLRLARPARLHHTHATTPANPMSPRLLLPITLAVVCAHGLGLWALQSGWEQPAAKAPISNSVTVMTARVEMPQPLPLPQAAAATVVPPAAPAPRDEATAPPRPKSAKPIAHQQAAAEPKAKAVLEPAPVASSSGSSATVEALPAAASSPAPQLIATNAIANASNNPATTQATSPAPNPLELPSSTAAYLNNPPPPYPQLSKRLGEQGKVVVRALIEINGSASQAQIQASSGYQRLDEKAIQTVLQWRYKPGKRAGAAEAMWFNIPISFVLD